MFLLGASSFQSAFPGSHLVLIFLNGWSSTVQANFLVLFVCQVVTEQETHRDVVYIDLWKRKTGLFCSNSLGISQFLHLFTNASEDTTCFQLTASQVLEVENLKINLEQIFKPQCRRDFKIRKHKSMVLAVAQCLLYS